MMRRFASVARAQSVRSAVTLPEGFSFVESKVNDKPLTDNYEAMDVLRLTLTRQDEFIFKEENVKCVTVSTQNGDMGVFPGHAYKIAKLKPSPIAVEYTDGTTKKFFTSGGFIHINNEGSCDINTVECMPLSELDLASTEKELLAAQAAVTNAKDDRTKAVAEIRVEVLEAVVQVLKH